MYVMLPSIHRQINLYVLKNLLDPPHSCRKACHLLSVIGFATLLKALNRFTKNTNTVSALNYAQPGNHSLL